MSTERARGSARVAPRIIASAGPIVFLAACNGTSSYLDATGTAGREEAVLGRWLTAVATAVVAIVCIAIVMGIARHRDDGASRDTRSAAPPALTPDHDG